MLPVRHHLHQNQDVADVARRALEAEIAIHYDAIVKLRGQINNMASISKLPPELLSEIFLQLTTDHYIERQHRPNTRATDAYRWIKITHVCRSWRAVALGTPRLWSHIVLTRKEVMEEMLARSKMAPLSLTVGITTSDDTRMRLLEKVMKESQRLKDIRIMGPARALQALSAKWTGAADILESLSITDSNAFDPGSVYPYNPVLPTLFSAQTPHLRQLEISRVVVSWDNPLFCSTLTDLTVVCRYDNVQKLGSFNQLLVALENMQTLHNLTLNESIPRVADDTTTVPPVHRTPVALPRLRSLHIVSDVLDCANFLNHITLPPDARLCVTGRTERGTSDLIRIFSEHLARARPLLSARLAPLYSAQVLIKGWRARDPGAGAADAADAELCLDAFPHSRSLQHLMRDAGFLARVERLEVLSMCAAWEWRALLARVPALRRLVLDGHPERAVFRALAEPQGVEADADAGADGAAGASGDGTLPVPALAEIVLDKARFDCFHETGEPVYLEEMVDCLVARGDHGEPVQSLFLTNCANVNEDVVHRLREVVVSVEWDGVRRHECSVQAQAAAHYWEDIIDDEDMYSEEDDGLFPFVDVWFDHHYPMD